MQATIRFQNSITTWATCKISRRERFATREQARLRVFWYIECFYNPRRRHSSLGMLSPIDYERRHQQEAIAA